MDKMNPLGNEVPYDNIYTANILYPIERKKDNSVSLVTCLGKDIWNLYEISYLEKIFLTDDTQENSRIVSKKINLNYEIKPRHFFLRLEVGAQSKNIIESKSLKLYLQSFHNQLFNNIDHFLQTVSADLRTQGDFRDGEISLQNLNIDELRQFNEKETLGEILEEKYTLSEILDAPDRNILKIDSSLNVKKVFLNHTFRSVCPVTHQPDWATVAIGYQGEKINEQALFAYLTSFRNHAAFHETCAELIFSDIMRQLKPTHLWVSLHFLRRGGIDINPVRHSSNVNLKDIPFYGRIFNRQ